VKSLLKNLVLLGVTTLVCIVVGEFAARFALRDITTTADNRSYFALKWKQANVRLNSLGYRDKEPEPAQAGTYRIAFIGDSYTFGQGIPEDARMSNILERELRQRRDVQVINLGNAGNNTMHEVGVLKMAIAKLKPNFVLLQWFVNDVDIAEVTHDSESALPAPSRMNEFKMSMRNQSVLYFLAAETWHRYLERSGSGYAEEMRARFGDPQSAQSKRAEQALLQFINLCKDNGIGVGIVLVPYFTPIHGREYPFLYLHQRVLATCESQGVPCLDLLPTFSPFMDDDTKYRDLWVNKFDSHMGPAANQIAAAALLKFFGAQWTTMNAAAQPGSYSAAGHAAVQASVR